MVLACLKRVLLQEGGESGKVLRSTLHLRPHEWTLPQMSSMSASRRLSQLNIGALTRVLGVRLQLKTTAKDFGWALWQLYKALSRC